MARPGHPHGSADGDGLADGAQRAATPVERYAQLRDRGVPTPTFYELGADGAPNFASSMTNLAERNPYHASVWVYGEDEYRKMRLFTTEDGSAGFALKDGDEIVSVYSHGGPQNRAVGQALLATAVAQGGRRLDCFDTILPRLYARAGFVPVARLAWDDEEAPGGWDYDTYERFNNGRPDVVFMAYDPEAVDSAYNSSGGTRITSYDDGPSAIDAYLTDVEQRGR